MSWSYISLIQIIYFGQKIKLYTWYIIAGHFSSLSYRKQINFWYHSKLSIDVLMLLFPVWLSLFLFLKTKLSVRKLTIYPYTKSNREKKRSKAIQVLISHHWKELKFVVSLINNLALSSFHFLLSISFPIFKLNPLFFDEMVILGFLRKRVLKAETI